MKSIINRIKWAARRLFIGRETKNNGNLAKKRVPHARFQLTLPVELTLLLGMTLLTLASCSNSSGGDSGLALALGLGGGGSPGLIGGSNPCGGTTPTCYVHAASGSDANSGDSNAPLASIGAALAKFGSGVSGRIHVAAGTYNTSATLVMQEGVSLYGGYSTANWTAARDPAANITTINHIGTGSSVIDFDSSTITSATVLDGFTMNGNASNNLGAVFVRSASPTISNNVITAFFDAIHMGTGDSAAMSPVVTNNTLTGGKEGDATVTINLTKYSDPVFSGNTINGPTDETGIHSVVLINPVASSISGASVTLQNNTINGATTTVSDVFGIKFGLANSVVLRISGNTINGGTSNDAGGGDSWGMYIVAPSTGIVAITGNTVNGGSAPVSSTGIYAYAKPLLISKNRITGQGKVDGTTATTIGIQVLASDAHLIVNNIVTGGYGTISYGLNIQYTSGYARIYNNTISGGSRSSHTTVMGIYLQSAVPFIENNIIYTPTGTTGDFCINEGPGSNMFTLRSNDLFNCTVLFYDRQSGCGGGTDCTLTQANALTGASGNVSVDPVFTDQNGADNDVTTFGDNDYTITGAPASVADGGLDLSADFTDDFAGTPRTTPWSIGAYN